MGYIYRTSTGWDLFAGYAYTNYSRHPTNVDLVFLNTGRLDEVKGDLVSFLDPDL